jgi:hypothetical protein
VLSFFQLLGTINANNNPAMAEILFGMLNADFDTEIFPSNNTQPVMSKLSVRCLAHILNLIVKEFLGVNNFYIPWISRI